MRTLHLTEKQCADLQELLQHGADKIDELIEGGGLDETTEQEMLDLSYRGVPDLGIAVSQAMSDLGKHAL